MGEVAGPDRGGRLTAIEGNADHDFLLLHDALSVLLAISGVTAAVLDHQNVVKMQVNRTLVEVVDSLVFYTSSGPQTAVDDKARSHLIPENAAMMAKLVATLETEATDWSEKAIEETVSNLSVEADFLSGAAQATAHVRKGLMEKPPKQRIDPEGKVETNLDRVLEMATEIYADWKLRCQAAIDDRELTEGDGVSDGYQEAMDALRTLHDETQELRDLIAEHDCDFDEVLPGTFVNADDLIAALDR